MVQRWFSSFQKTFLNVFCFHKCLKRQKQWSFNLDSSTISSYIADFFTGEEGHGAWSPLSSFALRVTEEINWVFFNPSYPRCGSACLSWYNPPTFTQWTQGGSLNNLLSSLNVSKLTEKWGYLPWGLPWTKLYTLCAKHPAPCLAHSNTPSFFF